jgi:hypothetical protein
MESSRRAVSVMSTGAWATGSDHCHARRLYMRRDQDFVAIDSLALPGGNAP